MFCLITHFIALDGLLVFVRHTEESCEELQRVLAAEDGFVGLPVAGGTGTGTDHPPRRRLHHVLVQTPPLVVGLQVDLNVPRDDRLALPPYIELKVYRYNSFGGDFDRYQGFAFFQHQIDVFRDGVEVGCIHRLGLAAVGVDELDVAVDLLIIVLDVNMLCYVLWVDLSQFRQQHLTQVLFLLVRGALQGGLSGVLDDILETISEIAFCIRNIQIISIVLEMDRRESFSTTTTTSMPALSSRSVYLVPRQPPTIFRQPMLWFCYTPIPSTRQMVIQRSMQLKANIPHA